MPTLQIDLPETLVTTQQAIDLLVAPGPITYNHLALLAGEVVATTTLGDYRGDYVFVVRRDDAVGLLIAGYGSCSGCDALRSVLDADEDHLVAELTELAQRLAASVRWFHGTNELVEWLTTDDTPRWWSGEQANLAAWADAALA